MDRNRLKRRLRELVRVELLPALREQATSSDVAFRARREAYGASFEALRNDVLTVRGHMTLGTTAP